MQHLPEVGLSRSIPSGARDIEAANVIVRQRHPPNWRGKYVVHLYERTRRRKGHSVAVGATARYLAEATYWVLKKSEPYREPPHWGTGRDEIPVSLSQGQVRAQHIVPRSWRYGSTEIRDLIGPPLANVLMPP